MKLHHFADPHGNFGDDLNPWLWARLLGDALDDDGDELLVGIGTLLNHRIPAAPIKHVFGSGHGYGERPIVDDRWRFIAVRGYETARALQLPKKTVVTDGAVMLRFVVPASPASERSEIGFMPHALSNRYFDWQIVSAATGMRFIDARWSVDRVLHELSQCRKVVCEAMHGAIVSDALRIPWIPVVCYDYISAFKWRDWLSTLELPYAPNAVTSLFHLERDATLLTRLKNQTKRALGAVNLASPNWTPPPPPRTGPREMDAAVATLRQVMQQPGFLSADRILDQHLDNYADRLDAFRRDRGLCGRQDPWGATRAAAA